MVTIDMQAAPVAAVYCAPNVTCETAQGAQAGAPPITDGARSGGEVEPAPEALPPAPDNAAKLDLGVTLRGRYDLRFNDRGDAGQRRTSSHLSFDVLALTADYKSDTFFGTAQYRFMGGNFIYGKSAGYENYPGEFNFLMYAYGGVNMTDKDSLTAGVQPVPFDDRYWGSSILDDLAFVYGFEETYNLGVKYKRDTPAYRIELGFFPSAGPVGNGISRNAARYSTNVVRADSYVPDGSNNEERNMLIGNVRYTLLDRDGAKLSATASAWLSTIHNLDTRQDGSKRIFAASLTGSFGPWHGKALVARHDIDPRNPGRRDLITVGGFDSAYNIATDGTYVFGEVGRDVDTGPLPFTIQPYVAYSRFIKHAAGFRDSQRFDLGAVWSTKQAPRFTVYSELLVGRNDPYVGAGQFISGAAQGGDDRWKTALLVIFAYSI